MMQNSNFKVYLGISIALVVLLMLILIIPFSKKTSSSQQTSNDDLITPTSVEINPSQTDGQLTSVPAQFTGVNEEELPQEIFDASTQKQDLRSLLPISLSSFSIDFNYEQDKFTVTLSEPKDQSRTEFDQWRSNTYPAIDINQFNFQ